ncbi:hypothetical protein Ae201684P_007029 [Aphanomyces euteiches]|uniref:Tc1-like transposase DDE domain-containing protein n=1 Tax=Aphanomyces euteiches TaxID=100861 RepID=A0A6G0WVD0_9STRA|nr:hypothetical protein Ae201684_011323 [Aphanomyces euteiches]KAH9100837.1 hypothetical protein Ae201684P_007029 [Aphanomyces euteiches]KAH9147610.1 hypothetical protein AeRB84_008825 [Aphanomyces euteiches]
MHDYVHADEKWFNVTMVKRMFYAYKDEVIPVRRVKSKTHISKVMFLAAVAKPRYDYNRRQYFDGKIGIWPFLEAIPAKRLSKNRQKGVVELKEQPVNILTYTEKIMTQVIPAIQAKAPQSAIKNGIWIQDNASPHNGINTSRLVSSGIEGISVMNQPANSPDFDV